MGYRYNHNHSPPLDGKYNIQIPLMGPRNDGEIDDEYGVDREIEEEGVEIDTVKRPGSLVALLLMETLGSTAVIRGVDRQ